MVQAAEEATQSKREAADAELTIAERALAAVNEQLKVLQAAQPTGAAAVNRSTDARSDARSNARSNTRGGATKRAAAPSHGDSNNHLSSPQSQKKKPRRSPALLPRGLLQERK